MKIIERENRAIRTETVEEFVATDLGAPFRVVLKNSVKVRFDAETGEQLSYTIPDLRGLLRATAIRRILNPTKMSGLEIKFIRKAVCLKQFDLARLVEVTTEHLCKCETNKVKRSSQLEKCIRIAVLKTAIDLDSIDNQDARTKLGELIDHLFSGPRLKSVYPVVTPIEVNLRFVSVGKLSDTETVSSSDNWKKAA